MLDADNLIEEYVERYKCSQSEAVRLILEDLKLVRDALIRKMMEGELNE